MSFLAKTNLHVIVNIIHNVSSTVGVNLLPLSHSAISVSSELILWIWKCFICLFIASSQKASYWTRLFCS